ncbi:alanine racemase [Acetobacteraceae bacterium KSS8]|uniref:Alanine racemase n=1 Tax=Endosaccharibacter trunci TaxID=2812733 RepID=A0ABT1WBX7_9PROT|nr:alanine racemase [Acetobacteraceae bacterium KSS8]
MTVLPDSVLPDGHGGRLRIDLGAIAANWRALSERASGAECAAVVKANAYGLGMERVAPALHAAGARSFFVAHLAEGVALRAVLGPDAAIHVLNGIPPGTAARFDAHALLPVLNSLNQVAEWSALADALGRTLPAALQFDTGMSRFGLSPADADTLEREPWRLERVSVILAMSHLGCADTPDHPANTQQRAAFEGLRARFAFPRWSLAASSGIFLQSAFHYDLVRPGAALYGVPPSAARPNPMRPVIRLEGRVVQCREIPAGAWVGYGATHVAARDSLIATVAVGYADGFLRAGSGRGAAVLPGWPGELPIIGRISMDCLAVDATGVDPALLPEGAALELIGPTRRLEDAAEAAGTIGYEMLTALGARYGRTYEGQGS